MLSVTSDWSPANAIAVIPKPRGVEDPRSIWRTSTWMHRRWRAKCWQLSWAMVVVDVGMGSFYAHFLKVYNGSRIVCLLNKWLSIGWSKTYFSCVLLFQPSSPFRNQQPWQPQWQCQERSPSLLCPWLKCSESWKILETLWTADFAVVERLANVCHAFLALQFSKRDSDVDEVWKLPDFLKGRVVLRIRPDTYGGEARAVSSNPLCLG